MAVVIGKANKEESTGNETKEEYTASNVKAKAEHTGFSMKAKVTDVTDSADTAGRKCKRPQKMCFSIKKGLDCKYGKKCGFAHSITELSEVTLKARKLLLTATSDRSDKAMRLRRAAQKDLIRYQKRGLPLPKGFPRKGPAIGQVNWPGKAVRKPQRPMTPPNYYQLIRFHSDEGVRPYLQKAALEGEALKASACTVEPPRLTVKDIEEGATARLASGWHGSGYGKAPVGSAARSSSN